MCTFLAPCSCVGQEKVLIEGSADTSSPPHTRTLNQTPRIKKKGKPTPKDPDGIRMAKLTKAET